MSLLSIICMVIAALAGAAIACLVARKKQPDLAVDNHPDATVKAKLEELGKLKKKISDLQDELEDKEDDLDSLEKKLKRIKTENADLQEQLDKITKDAGATSEQLRQAREELEEKTSSLNLKIESLTFVQEILTADRVNDNATQNLISKVDAFVDFVKEDVQDSVVNADMDEADVNRLCGTNLEQWAIMKKKNWIQGKTTIALVGEFSAGKTSIVNRLLSQDNPDVPLLPVSTKATTAIPTYISGTNTGRTVFKFVTPNNEQKELRESTFRRVNKEVLDQVKGVSSLIQYFVMSYANPNLRDLSILDTPGFNSNDKEDAKRTIDVINECDALFWVFDVNAGTVNRTSIKLIKEHLKKPLFVVINKVDTKAKPEVDKVEKLIRKTLADEGLQIEGYIRFSSKAPLENLLTPIKSIKRDTAKDEYLNTLNETIGTYLGQYDKCCRQLKKKCTNLENRSSELDNLFNETINRLEDNCESAADVPHWEKHFFRDRYEMSEDEYAELRELLGDIKDISTDKLVNYYAQQREARDELNTAYKELEDARQKWQHLYRCKNGLDKRLKTLNM